MYHVERRLEGVLRKGVVGFMELSNVGVMSWLKKIKAMKTSLSLMEESYEYIRNLLRQL